jgi:hypothetical protein
MVDIMMIIAGYYFVRYNKSWRILIAMAGFYGLRAIL